jgi:anti-sigma B factor antagonist
MATKVATHPKREVIVVDIHGNLTLGKGTTALRKTLRDLIVQGRKRILLNMAGVSRIDSAGVGELVAAHTIITAAGGEIKLLHLGRRAHKILEIGKLYLVFDTFENQAEAIRSFTPTEIQARYAALLRPAAERGHPAPRL